VPSLLRWPVTVSPLPPASSTAAAPTSA
jgi:hypothetical protein